jgi:DMSO/TMAO reductase YedYZ molybdopterin-dependent catalytic subunit
MTIKHRLTRREALTTAAAAAWVAGQPATATAASAPPAAAKPLPAYVSWKRADALIVHTSSTIETRREAFGSSVITPVEHLYVRNNLPPPDASIVADPDGWMLSVEGVRTPRDLALRELRSLGLEVLPMVLQCSGNGRGYFPGKPSGTPWQVGAAGCVIWAGVPLARVIDLLGGATAGARFITGTGGEALPAGIDPDSVRVERSVPISALPEALLAWELNGAPIPLAHGGPLRLILPGYSGVNQIKYLRRLSLTAEESRARIMSHGYRIAPPGSKADPSQPSVLQMNVKSWINSPSPAQSLLRSGRAVVQGVALGGTQAVRRVEVSTDGGERWQRAKLVGPDLGRYAWRQFALEVDLPPGEHLLASRAVDARGNVQPRERMENVSGYNNNSWLDHAVRVQVQA